MATSKRFLTFASSKFRLERQQGSLERSNEVEKLCGNPGKLQSLLGDWGNPPLEETLGWMLEAGAALTSTFPYGNVRVVLQDRAHVDGNIDH